MHSRTFTILLTAAVSLCLPTASGRAGETDWKARLLKEAPDAWRSLRTLSEHIAGSFTVEVSGNNPKFPSRTTVTDFLIKQDSLRFEIQQDKDKLQTLGAFNPKYSFYLDRNVDGKISVRQIEPAASQEERLRERAAGLVLEYVFAPWFYNGESLSSWLQKPGFTIKQVFPQPTGKRTLVRVDFAYLPKEGKGQITPDKLTYKDPSWFLFDPEDSWVLVECHMTTWFGSMHRKITYGDRLQGLPFIKRGEEVVAGGPQGKDIRTTSWAITKIAKQTASDSDFTMSSFGLPEPTLQERIHRRWLWVLCGAGILGVLGLLLRRYLRSTSVQKT